MRKEWGAVVLTTMLTQIAERLMGRDPSIAELTALALSIQQAGSHWRSQQNPKG
ncbi:hypothetical protein [Pyrobaculum aerophilum]|uniref:hypothetical protein n=1 Tax=Pyrobaculum aerophilum TaxID=13773 RepID=UPI0021633D8F|nr:hypothetical protein [Pyrobaculum aerophilum]